MHHTDYQPSPKDDERRAPARTRADDFVPEARTLIIEDKSLKGGFVQIPRVLLHARNLSRHAKVLYAVLLSYAWQEEECFPGYARLCQDLQASENSVRTYMRELEAANLLRQKRRGLGRTNLYIIPDLRTAKIEVQEPQPLRVSKSAALEPQTATVLEPQSSRIPIEIETGKEESVEHTFEDSNARKVEPKQGAPEAEGLAPALSGGAVESMESTGAILGRYVRSRSRPRPETSDENYQRIQSLIEDRAREFADAAPLKSSVTRAWNLYKRSGLSISVFTERVFQARSLTQEATARITKTMEDPNTRTRRKSKMAYFFATLEDHLNPSSRAEQPQNQTTDEGGPSAERIQAEQRPSRRPEASARRRPDSEGPYAAWIRR